MVLGGEESLNLLLFSASWAQWGLTRNPTESLDARLPAAARTGDDPGDGDRSPVRVLAALLGARRSRGGDRRRSGEPRGRGEDPHQPGARSAVPHPLYGVVAAGLERRPWHVAVHPASPHTTHP